MIENPRHENQITPKHYPPKCNSPKNGKHKRRKAISKAVSSYYYSHQFPPSAALREKYSFAVFTISRNVSSLVFSFITPPSSSLSSLPTTRQALASLCSRNQFSPSRLSIVAFDRID